MSVSQPSIRVLTVTERDATVFLSLDFDAARDLRDNIAEVMRRTLHDGEAIGPIEVAATPGQTDIIVRFLQPLRGTSLVSLNEFLKAISERYGFTLLPRTVLRIEDMDRMNLEETLAHWEQQRKPQPGTST